LEISMNKIIPVILSITFYSQTGSANHKLQACETTLRTHGQLAAFENQIAGGVIMVVEGLDDEYVALEISNAGREESGPTLDSGVWLYCIYKASDKKVVQFGKRSSFKEDGDHIVAKYLKKKNVSGEQVSLITTFYSKNQCGAWVEET